MSINKNFFRLFKIANPSSLAKKLKKSGDLNLKFRAKLFKLNRKRRIDILLFLRAQRQGKGFQRKVIFKRDNVRASEFRIKKALSATKKSFESFGRDFVLNNRLNKFLKKTNRTFRRKNKSSSLGGSRTLKSDLKTPKGNQERGRIRSIRRELRR